MSSAGIVTAETIYGLTVGGTVVPPWLVRSDDADVVIEAGELAPSGPLVWRSSELPHVECHKEQDGLLLSWAEARYLVASDRIVVDASAPLHALERHLNSLFSLILAGRGLPCLHGLVVADAGRALGILARSGSGKSTTGLAMLEHGWGLVTDDLMPLGPDGSVRRGPPFIRVEGEPGPQSGELDPGGKLRRYSALYEASAKLSGVVVLEAGAKEVTPLSGVAAVDVLLNNVYNPIVTSEAEASSKMLRFAQMAGSVPMFVVPAKSAPPLDLAAQIIDLFDSECDR